MLNIEKEVTKEVEEMIPNTRPNYPKEPRVSTRRQSYESKANTIDKKGAQRQTAEPHFEKNEYIWIETKFLERGSLGFAPWISIEKPAILQRILP